MSQVETISSAAMVLLSSRLSAGAISLIVLVVVLPCTLLLLGVGFGVMWGWHRLLGKPGDSLGRTWLFFKWAVLGSGGVAWFVLTVLGIQAPAGPAPERAAEANLRTINTAQVTYLSSDGSYGTVPDLITAGLLDSRFAGSVSGYIFNVTTSGIDYTATALPASRQAGKYGYYSGADAVVRYAGASTATCNPCYPKRMSGMRVP